MSKAPPPQLTSAADSPRTAAFDFAETNRESFRALAASVSFVGVCSFLTGALAAMFVVGEIVAGFIPNAIATVGLGAVDSRDGVVARVRRTLLLGARVDARARRRAPHGGGGSAPPTLRVLACRCHCARRDHRRMCGRRGLVHLGGRAGREVLCILGPLEVTYAALERARARVRVRGRRCSPAQHFALRHAPPGYPFRSRHRAPTGGLNGQ